MWKITAFILGLFLTSWGLVFNIISLTYFNMGYDVQTFMQIMSGKYEMYLTPFGILLIIIGAKRKRH